MSKAPIKSLLCALSIACIQTLSNAQNLGVRGSTYEKDRDGREQIKDILREKEKNGELAKFWSDYRAKTIDAIKNPAPLGVATNFTKKSELRELKFTFPQDILDEKGRVVVKKGTLVEPLKILPLTAGLIFIDGRDPKQVEYAIAKGRKQPMKIVLTAGSPYALRHQFKNAIWSNGTQTIPFYFDQQKNIINTLNRLYGVDVKSVPVALSQQGTRLLVEFGGVL